MLSSPPPISPVHEAEPGRQVTSSPSVNGDIPQFSRTIVMTYLAGRDVLSESPFIPNEDRRSIKAGSPDADFIIYL